MFDASLIAIGNALFLTGLTFSIGITKTITLFSRFGLSSPFFLRLHVEQIYDQASSPQTNTRFWSDVTFPFSNHSPYFWFVRRDRLRGTICFFSGIAAVVVKRWGLLGMLLQVVWYSWFYTVQMNVFHFFIFIWIITLTAINLLFTLFVFSVLTHTSTNRQGFGFLNLFGNFLPTVLAVGRQVPGLGHLLDLPGVSQSADFLAGKTRPKYSV